jgi:hypothetical protein
MELNFNMVLAGIGIDPADVRLLRHQTGPYAGRTPYSLWRDDGPAFLNFQAIQSVQNRSRLAGRYWAGFVVNSVQSTLFAGLWKVKRIGAADPATIDPLRLTSVSQRSEETDLYAQTPVDAVSGLSGRLSVEWGSGTRMWIQRADSQPKPIVEITRVFQEEAFPGFARFRSPLSAIEALPSGWRSTLSSNRGIYLLTCPRTREQYVGSATGDNGFLGRWLSYVQNGHGGNIRLKSRDASDYQVSVLEVAGSATPIDEIFKAERYWKDKLQTNEMGLNGN